MIREIEAYVMRAASEAMTRAKARRGFALRSYLNGEWQVIAREHPETAGLKHVFLKAAGVR